MPENIIPFNSNSQENALEILRLGIFNLCGLLPDVHDGFFELSAVGLKQSRLLRHQLKSIPGVAEALTITKDQDYPDDWTFTINTKEYLEYFQPNLLRTSMDFRDRFGKSFDERRYTRRLGELNSATKRDWGQLQSSLYAEEVVQMVPADREPASREAQVMELAHQLLGDDAKSVNEAKSWLEHMVRSEKGAPPRTAFPSPWASKEHVLDMANNVKFNREERKRLRRVFRADDESAPPSLYFDR